LEESARLYPHNIAIDEVTGRSASLPSSFERRALTYGELNDKVSLFADQIEQVLQRLDWPDFQGTQKMVPLFLPSSTELSICMNAISKAGHSFCALQTDAPEDRLRNLLNDLNCNGILGVGSNPWASTEFGQNIIWIDFFNPFACLKGRSISTYPVTRRQISQDDTAYVIYNSGSTGTPKGVITSHRNTMTYLRAWDSGPASLPTGPRLRWMIVSTPTFDIMLMDNFMPLLEGGTVCIAVRPLFLSSPESIMHELRASATIAVGSTAMILRPERLPTLTIIIVGGEPVGQRIVDKFAQKPGEQDPPRRLVEGYGPAEATVMVTNHICQTNSRPSVLGTPIPGTRLVVLDENQSTDSGHCVLAPLGVAGELPMENSIQDSITVDSTLHNGNDQLHYAPSDDVAAAVQQAFVDALEEVDIECSTVLADTELDSLRALIFLQNLEDHGLDGLEIDEILSAALVDDVINLVIERTERAGSKKANTVPPQLSHEAANDAPSVVREQDIAQVEIQDVPSTTTVDSIVKMIDGWRSDDVETCDSKTHHPNGKHSHIVAATATTTTTTTTTTPSPLVDGIDVSKIPADDGDEVFELSVAAKIGHFDYHCRAPALAALGLESTQVEQSSARDKRTDKAFGTGY
jgi:AMP-binding enzyme